MPRQDGAVNASNVHLSLSYCLGKHDYPNSESSFSPNWPLVMPERELPQTHTHAIWRESERCHNVSR